jgi:hypothetical protein
VADHVGERLLHDPVGGQVHRRRQLGGRAVDHHPDRRPAPCHPGDQLVELRQARHGRLRPLSAGGLAQHADGRPQLLHRARAGLPDRRQRLAGLLRPAVQDVQRHPRPEVDHRDAVRHHVVQLPGDPQPLVVGAAARLLGGATAPGPRHHADPQRHQQQRQPGEQHPGELLPAPHPAIADPDGDDHH